MSVVAVAVVAIVVVAGLVVLRATDEPSRVAQGEPGPVLVVPGYGGRVASLDPLVDELRSQGRDVVVVRPTAGGTGDLRAQAVRLGDAAQRAMQNFGASSVDVVGYSAGGVVARLWVRDEGGARVARRVISVGSPQHGTDVAALAAEVAGSCPTACEQLAPDSDLLRALNAGDETPAGPRWITVRSASDRVVTPTASARLDDALDLLVQDVCPSSTASHGDLPGDPVVLAALRSTLAAGQPRAPQDVRC
jgi:triacylglycerol lipase